MKEYIGKACNILIILKGRYLFYNVKKVLDVTENHISFIDKFGNNYTYRKENVNEINMKNNDY